LDESSVNSGMTRLYGWGLKSERINDYVPDVRFERTSIISALGLRGVVAPLMYTGTLNSELFGTYVKQCLAPALQECDTLVMDNLAPHKVSGVIQPLIDKGIKVLFLPPYSPDFNPIELMWAKMKAILRILKPRNPEEMQSAMRNALLCVKDSDCDGWFRHCGYCETELM